MQPTVNIIGIKIFVGTSTIFIDELIESVTTQKSFQSNRLVSATSAHGMIHAQSNPSFKTILNSFYYNIPDGQPTAWIGRLKGFKTMERCPGVGTFDIAMRSTAQYPIQHFFCGGKEGVAQALRIAVKNNLGNNNTCGAYTPPFRNLTTEEFISLGEQINASKANIVWIGLSTPKQEMFAYELAKYCKVDYIITVGAVFDFFTDNLDYAPKWVRDLGMEWFYRLCKEPKRLFKRYIEVVPKFIWYNILDLLHLKKF